MITPTLKNISRKWVSAPSEEKVLQTNANGPDVLRFERFFLADEQSPIPRSLVSADGTYKHGGSFATQPSASLYRERIIYNDCAVWLFPNRITDRPLLARSGR